MAYYVKASGQTLYFTDESIFFRLTRYEQAEAIDREDIADRKAESLVFSLDFLGANKSPLIEGRNKDDAIVSYFIGNDPDNWHTSIPTYREIVYKDIYPGMDLRLYGKEGLLEYEFVVGPGASVADIVLAYDGVDSIAIEAGELVASTAFGDIKQTQPYIYQQIGDDEAEVDGGFKLLEANTYGFEVAACDASYPLVIDPGLAYSTYLGGNGSDSGYGIAVDSGFAYVTGLTGSTDFPTRNQYMTDPGDSNYDAFVTTLGAPEITVDPLAIDFGSVELGSSSAPETVTVSNNGTAYLDIGTIALAGANADQFSTQNDNVSNQSIAPGASATVEVVFNPTSTSAKTATLSIPSNDFDEDQVDVALSGNGIPGAPHTVTLTADPTSITADGASTSMLTATVEDQYGNDVADGTDVVFNTDHGTLGSSTVTKQTSGGVATATLTSESSTETVIATVTATANGASDATAVFFIPAGGAEVEESQTETITDSGTMTDTPTGGDVSIEATGEHTITIAEYESNPGGTPNFAATGNFYDVHLDDDTGVESLTIEFCPAWPWTVIYYWDGSNWKPASNQRYFHRCKIVTITSSTFPSLSDLTGLVFATGTLPPEGGVGGEAYPVNKLAILAPWIGLATLLIGGISWLILRRRKA